jgi:hypothetical protein
MIVGGIGRKRDPSGWPQPSLEGYQDRRITISGEAKLSIMADHPSSSSPC